MMRIPHPPRPLPPTVPSPFKNENPEYQLSGKFSRKSSEKYGKFEKYHAVTSNPKGLGKALFAG
jgi:hypothetical protein